MKTLGLILIAVLLGGCIAGETVGELTGATPDDNKSSLKKPTIQNVSADSDKLKLEGINMDTIQSVRVQGPSPGIPTVDRTFAITAQTSTYLEAKLTSFPSVNFVAESFYNLIITTASAQTVIPITFTINNYTITSSKLASSSVTTSKIQDKAVTYEKIETSSAADGDILVYNSSLDVWEPMDIGTAVGATGSGTGGGGGGGLFGTVTLGNGMDQQGVDITTAGTIGVDVGSGTSLPGKIPQLDSYGNYTFKTDNSIEEEPYIRIYNSLNGSGSGSGYFGMFYHNDDDDDGVIDNEDEYYDFRIYQSPAEMTLGQEVGTGFMDQVKIFKDSGKVKLYGDLEIDGGLVLGEGANQYTFPGDNGSASGLFLYNDGSGNLSWGNPAAGGITAVVAGSGIGIGTGGTILTINLDYSRIPGLNGTGAIDVTTLPAGALSADRVGNGDVDDNELSMLAGIDTSGQSIEQRISNLEGVVDTNGNTNQFINGAGIPATIDSDQINMVGGDKYFNDGTFTSAYRESSSFDPGDNTTMPTQQVVYDFTNSTYLKISDTEFSGGASATGFGTNAMFDTDGVVAPPLGGEAMFLVDGSNDAADNGGGSLIVGTGYSKDVNGPTTYLGIDDNEIQAYSGGNGSTLMLNVADEGNVVIGAGSSDIYLRGGISDNVNGVVTINDTATVNEDLNVIGDLNMTGVINGADASFDNLGADVLTAEAFVDTDTTAGTWYLDPRGDGGKVNVSGEIAGDVSIGAQHTGGGDELEVHGTATKSGGGAWGTLSDIRMKNIVGPYEKGLKEIVRLETITFHYKEDNIMSYDSDTLEIGFVAQDVEKIFPEAITLRHDGFLDMNVHAINIAMVNAIKELDQEIKENHRLLEYMQNGIQDSLVDLERRVSSLEEENLLLRKQNEAIIKILCQKYHEDELCQ